LLFIILMRDLSQSSPGAPGAPAQQATPVGMTSAAPTQSAQATRRLPKSLLYSTSARIGGTGLDVEALEKCLAAYRGGFLGRVIGYANQQSEIPGSLVQSLRWHPVRLISFLDRPYYYGAKKKYVDWIASRQLATGRYDLFHGWSGDSLQSLRVTRKLKIPSLLEIPTWHREGGGRKGTQATKPNPTANSSWFQKWKSGLLPEKARYLEEYQLADLLLVFSRKAADSFRSQGFTDQKLFYLPNGVDVDRFKPGTRPSKFRAIFSGALIERKGIHIVLEAWHRLDLEDAELWLIGTVHDEAKPHLKKFWRDNIKLLGFRRDIEKYLNQGTIYVFPSRLEGNAKTVNEAAACGLPIITTRESGDVVNDGVEGIIVPPGDVEAVMAGILHLYKHPELVDRMAMAARKRVVENFTWDHCRARLLQAYEIARQMTR
jgi:glycosyltransferase involved in cell wall biosynthesis